MKHREERLCEIIVILLQPGRLVATRLLLCTRPGHAAVAFCGAAADRSGTEESSSWLGCWKLLRTTLQLNYCLVP